ncbi:3-isopropylmalate dehydratase [Caballeronia sp. LZ033]|uniref:3-isopropylmalate dehydratase n=1 Tax=Caballeronia sp. LZ033 TaxID=3038566 RepID=UPI002854833E|nr:3-isopropylmalate dehydratase [Caballeronia sp. LZ033]MDR5815616.1 3-isopropylmalate dehydratase [Caballeronia sp. LZ033]
MTAPLTTTGRVWKLPDDVSSDALISANHVFNYDPRVLRKHLLHEVRPEIAEDARPGDMLMAGKRFAHGSQHSHPFLAMKEIGLGLLAMRLTRAPYRISVYMGVPFLEISAAEYDAIADGETLEIDYRNGVIRQTASGVVHRVPTLPPFVMDIVSAGGGLAYLQAQASPVGNGVRGA